MPPAPAIAGGGCASIDHIKYMNISPVYSLCDCSDTILSSAPSSFSVRISIPNQYRTRLEFDLDLAFFAVTTAHQRRNVPTYYKSHQFDICGRFKLRFGKGDWTGRVRMRDRGETPAIGRWLRDKESHEY